MEENTIYSEHVRRKRLIRSFLIRTVVWAILTLCIFVFDWYVTKTPILTNQMAIGQMDNSNEWFVTMTAYQEFANKIESIRTVLTSIIIGIIGADAIDLVKKLKIN